MIGRLHGKLIEKTPPQVLVDVGGVGYEVDVPMSTFCNLPAEGSEITLLTHFIVREDAQLLYGFATAAERQTFRALIRISGVGPRIALARAFRHEHSGSRRRRRAGQRHASHPRARHRQENGRPSGPRAQGQARRQRLRACGRSRIRSPGRHSERLMALGYSEREAQASVRALPAEVTVSEGIRLALKALAR